MNRLDGLELFDKVRHNATYGNNAIMLAESRAILNQVNLTSTKVWGLLSKKFLEKETSKEERMLEMRAFYDFVASKFVTKDFNRPFNKIAEKVDSMLHQSDGILLEHIIVERLMKNTISNKKFSFQKGVLESDNVSKADFLVTYKPNGLQYRLGAQITTVKDNQILIHKMRQVKNVVNSIDVGINKEKYAKKQMLDTMMFVDFFGYHATKKGTNSEKLRNALLEWNNNGYEGEILDYIKSERLKNEIIAFCEIFPNLIEKIFEIIDKKISSIENVNGFIHLNNGATVKYYFNKNTDTIELKVYHKPQELLFRANFYINKTIIQKINPQTLGNILNVANY